MAEIQQTPPPGGPGATDASRALPSRRRRYELLFGLLLLGLLAYRFGPEMRVPAGIPAMAPDLELVTVEGDTLRLAELRGSVVLINFWATWCAPCLNEMPALQRVWEENRERGLVVVGLSVDRGPISDFVGGFRAGGLTYPIAYADERAVRGLGHGGAVPTSFLIDRDGRIVERIIGAISEAEIRARVDPLLDAR